MNAQHKKLGFHLGILFIPFGLLLFSYFYWDPFEVIYPYNPPQLSHLSPVQSNRDYHSIELFLQDFPNNYYNAFIFGNSRSFYYKISDWKKYIGQSNCFHFNASGETLYGIDKKINFLSEKGVKIDYALIVLDASVLRKVENSEGVVFLKHPKLSGQSPIKFQVEFLKGYFNLDFLLPFASYKINHAIEEGPNSPMILHPMLLKRKGNELSFDFYDSIIENSSSHYYLSKKHLFYSRSTEQRVDLSCIGKPQSILLNNIYTVLQSNKTKYKIIISPLYDQLKLNPSDLNFLKNLFGAANVFDFSGINATTKDYTNYYETSHYRSTICSSLIDSVYGASFNNANTYE
jgi:hypothetical protein